MNKKLSILKKKISLVKISRFIIQLIFLYFFSGLFTLAFTGFRSIYLGLARENFSIANSFTFLAAFAAVVVLSVLIGRFFCGWICAFGTFNDLVYLVSRKIFKKKIKISQAVDEKLKYIKYIVLLGIIIFMWSMDLSPEKSIDPWDAFAQLPQFKTMAPEIPIAFIFLALITIGAMFIERFFCRYLCPLGAIQAILSKFKIINISKPSEKCGKCQLCTGNCPMGINLSQVESVESGECIACLKCVDTCYRSNPKVVIFKKLNMQWYSSTAAAILVFSFIFWGSKFVKPEAKIGAKVSAAQMSKVDEAVFSDGVYIGVGTGFRPNLKVQVKITKGRIQDIKIISHEETKGYYEQAFDVVPKEIIAAQSSDVDAVSGATKSSNGIKSAVKDALNKARKDKTQNEIVDNNQNQENSASPQAESTSADASMDKNAKFKDGTYTGVGIGYQPGLKVSVTIKDGKIADIKILSNNETPGFREKAFSVVPNEIISAQTTDVDAVSGATFSSRGIMTAVKNALQKALISGELPEGNTSTTASTAANNSSANVSNVVANLPVYTGKGLYKDGVYTGIGKGFEPNLKVSVTVKDGKITDITILSHNETTGFYEKPFTIVPKEIISKQDTNVDTVSGATRSSNGIISAVNDALKNARLDGTTIANNNPNNDTSGGSNNNSTSNDSNNGSSNNTPTNPSDNNNNPTDSGDNKPVTTAVHLYKDGRYTGIGTGLKNNLTVDVTVKDNRITDINLITYKEGIEYIKKTMTPMSDRIIAAQSTDVDVVSGATDTSNGIKDAVNKALEKAVYKDGTFTGTGRGYNRNNLINLKVTVKDSKISNIDIISQSETANYFEKAWPAVPEAIIKAQSTTVDTVSGATKSSNGIISAINNALATDTSAGETSTYPSKEEVAAPFRDGVYTGKGKGHAENLTVNVTIKDNKIIKIDLGANDETPEYFKNVWPLLPNEMIEKQSADVDAVSGATRSTNGVINAVKDALRKSHDATLNLGDAVSTSSEVSKNNTTVGDNSGNSEVNNNTGNTTATDSNTGTSQNGNSTTNSSEVKYKDGVYEGTGDGFQPNLKLSVTVKDRKITDIKTISNNDTESFYNNAFNTVPKEIISKQSTEVDSVSGATFSSKGIMTAVKNALENSMCQ